MSRGKSHCVEHNGQPMSLREYADTIGIPRGTIMRRWSKGDRGDRLSRAPDQRYNKRGQTSNVSEEFHGAHFIHRQEAR